MNLLHYSISSHKAESVTSFLNEQGVCVLEHLPYSSDLAPYDFFLHPRLKKKLAVLHPRLKKKLAVRNYTSHHHENIPI